MNRLYHVRRANLPLYEMMVFFEWNVVTRLNDTLRET